MQKERERKRGREREGERERERKRGRERVGEKEREGEKERGEKERETEKERGEKREGREKRGCAISEPAAAFAPTRSARGDNPPLARDNDGRTETCGACARGWHWAAAGWHRPALCEAGAHGGL